MSPRPGRTTVALGLCPCRRRCDQRARQRRGLDSAAAVAVLCPTSGDCVLGRQTARSKSWRCSLPTAAEDVGKADWLLHLLQDGVLMGRSAETVQGSPSSGRPPMRQAARADPATLPAAANTGALHRRRGHAITGKLVVKVLKGLPMSTRKALAAIARAGNNNPRGHPWRAAQPAPHLHSRPQAQGWQLHRTAGQSAIADRLQEPGGLNYCERMAWSSPPRSRRWPSTWPWLPQSTRRGRSTCTTGRRNDSHDRGHEEDHHHHGLRRRRHLRDRHRHRALGRHVASRPVLDHDDGRAVTRVEHRLAQGLHSTPVRPILGHDTNP